MTLDTPLASVLPGSSLLDCLDLGSRLRDLPNSTVSFPDGGLWRIEIPSVEGPAALAQVFAAADAHDVPIHRVSQGSGVFMHTDAEIHCMVQSCRERGVELCLFVRPGASWDIGAARDSPAGSVGARSRGVVMLAAALAEAYRAAELGVRSLLVADEGVLWSLHRLRSAGQLPADLQLKVSVMAGPVNPASLQVHEHLGADTVNVPSDLTIGQLAELRASSSVPLDIYVESPDNIGGFVRQYELCELIRVAAPVYLKFGLRNAPDVYPSGEQLESMILSASRERVRRARLGLDLVAREGGEQYLAAMSALGRRDQPVLRRFPTMLCDL